jgi:hypothetical protein
MGKSVVARFGSQVSPTLHIAHRAVQIGLLLRQPDGITVPIGSELHFQKPHNVTTVDTVMGE